MPEEESWNLADFNKILDKALYTEHVNIVFKKIERDLRIKRLSFVYGFLAVLAAYLIWGPGAHLMCNFITFILPAWIFLKSIEKDNVTQDITKWLTFWMIYNGFDVFEYIYLSDQPEIFYHWLLKCIFLSLCFLPPWSVAGRIYEHLIHPFLGNYLKIIDSNVANAKAALAQKGSFTTFVVSSTLLFIYWHDTKYKPELLCNYVGFFYPVYATLKSMNQPESKDSVFWLTYWVIYSILGILEFIHEIIWLPFYWIYWPVKLILLLMYLVQPSCAQGQLHVALCVLVLRYRPVKRANMWWSKQQSVYASQQLPQGENKDSLTTESEESRLLCKICMNAELSVTFVPCGHLVCCSDCGYSQMNCPVCRAEIDSVLRTYMS